MEFLFLMLLSNIDINANNIAEFPTNKYTDCDVDQRKSLTKIMEMSTNLVLWYMCCMKMRWEIFVNRKIQSYQQQECLKIFFVISITKGDKHHGIELRHVDACLDLEIWDGIEARVPVVNNIRGRFLIPLSFRCWLRAATDVQEDEALGTL